MQTKKITSIIIIVRYYSMCYNSGNFFLFFNSGDAPQEEEFSTVAIVTTEVMEGFCSFRTGYCC